MIAFPNCKINLGLNIVEKRSDNFHNIETVFIPVLLKDIVEIIPSQNFEFTASGLDTGLSSDNLCVKAYDLVKKRYPKVSAVKMHLYKAVPLGAGLGGGSADGAFILMLLNNVFDLKLSQQQLMDMALQLGSDCPFFILNKPCIATGRGEILQPLNLNLSGYKIIIVNPGIHISTPWAFSQIKIQQRNNSVAEIIQQPVEIWKQFLTNDFEEPVFKKYPQIQKIKEYLYSCGAVYVSLSGSGSTVFGIFKEEPELHFKEEYFVKSVTVGQ